MKRWGSFPTDKVIGGFDFVGSNYDVLDEDTSNDIPRPDPDPLDRDGHGTHTAGTCCGDGVPGVGKGVAPAARLYAIKVWDVGNSSADVLVAGYEFAVDPNQDGSTTDHMDVLSFSGGVDYGTSNSAEAIAAERVVGIGTVFVASAGNSGNQAAGASGYILGTPAAAPGVIAVAASIDQFVLNTITVNEPAVTLPDGGFMAVQDWGADLPAGGFTSDLFDARESDRRPTRETRRPADQQFCTPSRPGSLDGLVPVVFKGATGDGDCSGSTKVFNAQEAGATRGDPAVRVRRLAVRPRGEQRRARPRSPPSCSTDDARRSGRDEPCAAPPTTPPCERHAERLTSPVPGSTTR